MKTIPNLLLLCGSGRHIGKTALLCALIAEFHKKYKIIAVKISPNFHSQLPADALIEKGEGYNVYIEKEISDKDTSLFMQAGATRSYYIETEDECIEKAFHVVHRLTAKDELIVCESGKLRKYFKPGLMLFIAPDTEVQQSDKKDFNSQFADLIINIPVSEMKTYAQGLAKEIFVKYRKWRIF